LTVVPEVVVQDELHSGILIRAATPIDLQERFYAITTPLRHRVELFVRAN
jgi:LysR family transcriptional activator of nhaA